MSLMGIDVGTTGCKAAAYSDAGVCLGGAYREYPTLRPAPLWAELDSRAVFDAVCDCVAETATLAAKDPVTALCVSSMGEAVTPVSADREILGNSILSSDLRGAEHTERLVRELGVESFYEINSNIPAPNYSLPKLLWTREHMPALFDRAWKFLLWGDLVGFMLGAAPVTGHSLANRTLLFDISREDWSDPLLAWAGIPREKLPACVPAGTVSGTISGAMAERTGLPKGTAVVAGGHDQCCAALGAGVCAPGRAVCGLGTIECVTPVFSPMPPAGEMLARGLGVEHSLLPGQYVSFIYNQSGVLVKWFRDCFARNEGDIPDGDLYGALMAEMPTEPTGLMVLPHFDVTGAPGYITDSAGVITGLRTDTRRGEILKALIEGAAFWFVEPVEGLRVLGVDTSELVATGGGAKSDAWLQIKADIFGVPIVRPRVTECGVLGAAMLAGMASGAFKSASEAVECLVRRDRVFEPDPARHTLYRERHALWRGLYPALRETLRAQGAWASRP